MVRRFFKSERVEPCAGRGEWGSGEVTLLRKVKIPFSRPYSSFWRIGAVTLHRIVMDHDLKCAPIAVRAGNRVFSLLLH